MKKKRTVVLAEIKGPAAIHHIWTTIAAEAFYGRKLVLRAFWDGEEAPSVETPIGDFFGVGHGLNRDLSSLPIACSSEGRARNASSWRPRDRTRSPRGWNSLSWAWPWQPPSGSPTRRMS